MSDLTAGTPAPRLGPEVLDRVRAIERPDAKLWTYYVLASLLLGPLFFLALIPLRFRFRSLRYRFDDEGVAMRWGILFRREIHLTYERIQDIHLVSNAAERWLGLARIKIQTASGSSKAEMTLEGVKEFEILRDFLYSRMQGLRESPTAAAASLSDVDRRVLSEVRRATEELRTIRRLLAEGNEGRRDG